MPLQVLSFRKKTFRRFRTQGQTERFLILFEKTSFADNDWRFSEWGKFPVCPPFSSPVSSGFPPLPVSRGL
jgi:hypothetical protein